MANKKSDMPAQPRDIDRRDSADDSMRGDAEGVRGVGVDSDDEFEDTEDLEDDEEEGTF
jgi:hypothetical protein